MPILYAATVYNSLFIRLLFGISILVGYLMPNTIYTHVLNVYDLLTHFVDKIFKTSRAHFFAHS